MIIPALARGFRRSKGAGSIGRDKTRHDWIWKDRKLRAVDDLDMYFTGQRQKIEQENGMEYGKLI